MLSHRIYTLSRILASRHATLRGTLAAGNGTGPAAFAGSVTAGQDAPAMATPDPSNPHPGAASVAAHPEFLFVQPFESGTWAPKDGDGGTYTLTLTGAAANTIYFSDRPERIVGFSSMQDFLDGLGFTPANPPNAALVAGMESGRQDILVIELQSPNYDADSGTLTYNAKLLANYSGAGLAHLARQQSDDALPGSFASGALFVDDCPTVTFECIEIDVAPAVPVGTVQAKQCYDSGSATCDLCQDPEAVCFTTYPVACKKRTYDYVNNRWVIEHSCTAHPA